MSESKELIKKNNARKVKDALQKRLDDIDSTKKSVEQYKRNQNKEQERGIPERVNLNTGRNSKVYLNSFVQNNIPIKKKLKWVSFEILEVSIYQRIKWADCF